MIIELDLWWTGFVLLMVPLSILLMFLAYVFYNGDGEVRYLVGIPSGLIIGIIFMVIGLSMMGVLKKAGPRSDGCP